MKICYNCFRKLYDIDKICPFCGSSADLKNEERYPNALPCGSILAGKYITGRVLDADDFGYTYVAQNYLSKNLIAIKEFFSFRMMKRNSENRVFCEILEEKSFELWKKRFMEEAFTLKRFSDNPLIFRAEEIFEENNTVYLVLDYFCGISLREHIKGGKLLWEDSLEIILPVMEALTAIHAEGVIHRNVTPDNIILADDGSVRLLGFAGSKCYFDAFHDISEPGDPSFSISKCYFPLEENVRTDLQGPWTDVYAAAAILYHMVTGVVPPLAAARLTDDKLIPPGRLEARIPHGAEAALLKALSVKEDDRYRTMAEFREELLKDGAQTAHGNHFSRRHWPDPITLDYLKKIGLEERANRIYQVQVSIPESILGGKIALSWKMKTVTIFLYGWQRSDDALAVLKENHLNPDKEYGFTDWPRCKPVFEHPAFLRSSACACELRRAVYHVREYNFEMSPPTLYGCPKVSELEKQVLSKTVEVIEYESKS